MSTAEKIIVGMSGGVDSSVAAWLLLQQGYDVEGLFMKNWEEDDTAEYCSAAVDLADAEQVCARLGIRLHTVNFSGEYWDNVFEHFLHEYQSGRTPNPDVICNREIKFKAFVDHARTLGARRIATGHYARLRRRDGRYQLLRAVDANKDQSYFLYLLDQQQLACALFPLGEIDKPAVRGIAREQGFAVHDKKDSTGICFIGERKFRDFLERFLPARPGDIVDLDGNRLGEHGGLMYYTIGQRQGLGIGGIEAGRGDPWYVVEKRLDSNRLVVAQGVDHPRLFHRRCRISAVHWIDETIERPGFRCSARTRYRQKDSPCELLAFDDGGIEVAFEAPQRAITPGQALVFYAGEQCLGGGTIDAAFA